MATPRQQRRQRLEDEQPLPAGQAVHALERMQDVAGERPTDNASQRNRHEEERERLGAPCRRKPVRQIKDHARCESSLGDTQQKAQDIEGRGRLDEDEAGRNHRPRQHDASEPVTCAHFVQHEIARYLEDEIAEKENACAKAVDGFAKAQVIEHLQLRKAHVDAIEIRAQVAQHQERYQAPSDFCVRLCFEARRIGERHPIGRH